MGCLGFHREITERRWEGYKIEEKNYAKSIRSFITNHKMGS